MKDIEISYVNFWETFNAQEHLITKLLQQHYNVNIIDIDNISNNTDLVIISNHFPLKVNLPCKTLYYSGENDFPDFNLYDYALTHMNIDYNSRHCRYPLWLDSYVELENRNKEQLLGTEYYNREFCSYVVSNNIYANPMRTILFQYINNNYKLIASGGRYLNNIGGPVDNKLQFISNFKFNIAAENSIVDGYITEKIADAFISKTIPIYYGTPSVYTDFNKDAFICCYTYKTLNDVLTIIKELDDSEDKYLEMLNQPIFNYDNYVNDLLDNISKFLVNIIENGKRFNHKFGRSGILNEMPIRLDK